MMLNLGNNAFYGVFMPLHHCLGFPSMILEGAHDPPWIRPWNPGLDTFLSENFYPKFLSHGQYATIKVYCAIQWEGSNFQK